MNKTNILVFGLVYALKKKNKYIGNFILFFKKKKLRNFKLLLILLNSGENDNEAVNNSKNEHRQPPLKRIIALSPSKK